MFWVTNYYLKEKKESKYQEWLLSEEAKKLDADIEKETGVRYIDTYWNIFGGDFQCEDWWEVPNWEALDKWRESKAVERAITRFVELDFWDTSRPYGERMVRTTKDVKIMGSP